MQNAAELLRDFGFPIVMCGALFWFINKMFERYSADLAKLSEAVNNNTLVITRLLERKGGEEDEKGN